MTTKPPLFSIITITKNNLRGLQSTKDGLKQSCTDYEWIVIDGNSSDGTKDYLLTQNAQWISEPDNGLYDAMNKGIERAEGDYLIFMNAGDKLSDPDILATLSKVIAAEKPDFIYGDALESNWFYKKARRHEDTDWGMFTHHQAMMYKRSVIGTLRYSLRYKIASDYAFTRSFLKSAKTIHYCPAALCIFEEGGISQRSMRLGRTEQFFIRKPLCPFYKNAGIYSLQTLSAFTKSRWPGLYKKLRA